MQSRSSNKSKIAYEALETRLLLSATAPTVLSLTTDNRGQAVISFSQAINTRTLSSTTVLEYTAGADGVFGTRDDVLVPTTFSYSRGTLTVTGAVRADTRYRLVLTDSILGTDGVALNGTGGRRGGNFDITTSSTTLTAEFVTIAGTVDVNLVNNSTLKPTLTNFLYYADHGLWDDTFFNRNGEYDSSPLPIIQGGQYDVTKTNTVGTIPTIAAINEVTGLSNTAGTLAVARTSSLTASETDSWYFNTADDTELDAEQYTVFGTVQTRSLAVLAKLAAYPAEEAGSDLPVVNPTAIANRRGTLDPDVDLIIVSRIAMLTDFTTTSSAAPDLVRDAEVSAPAAEQLTEASRSPAIFSAVPVTASFLQSEQSVLG